MTTPATELRWDGRAVWWPPADIELLPGGDGNLWMCAQDAGTEMWAHFNNVSARYGRRSTEPVRLDGCSDQLRDILIESLSHDSRREDLAGALGNFMQMVGQEIVLEGAVPFEVQCAWDDTGDAPILKRAHLEFIPPASLIRVGSRLCQRVPAKAIREAHSRVVQLDPSRVVTFVPPHAYRRPLRTMRRAFPPLGRTEDRWMAAMARGAITSDFKAERRSVDTRRAKASAGIGWNARGLFQDHIADFHWTLRDLRWRRFCIETRDSILDTVAHAFRTIGALRNEQPTLVCENLPTLDHLDTREQTFMRTGSRIDELSKDL